MSAISGLLRNLVYLNECNHLWFPTGRTHKGMEHVHVQQYCAHCPKTRWVTP